MSAGLTRRSALRGSLAASLGLAAGVGPVLAEPVAVNPDARLVAMAAELEAVSIESDALARSTHLDCDEIPGWLEIEERRYQLLEAVTETPAEGMAGIVAKARVLGIRDVEQDIEKGHYLGCWLAEDVVRLFGGGSA